MYAVNNIREILSVFSEYLKNASKYNYRNIQNAASYRKDVMRHFFHYHRTILNILGVLLRFPWPEAEEQHFLLAGIENPLCQ